MPYHIEPKGANDFEVIEDGNSKVVGKHPTRKQAVAHLQALYANVPEAKKEASMDEVTEKASSEPGDYLIAEDREHPTTWHLQVRTNGKPDHRLMGAAWAALHEGYRGNKYEGPDKGAAIEKLKKLYEAEKMDTPATKEAQEPQMSWLDRVIATIKGDTPGHPFRGNQFGSGSGGAEGEGSISAPVNSDEHRKAIKGHYANDMGGGHVKIGSGDSEQEIARISDVGNRVKIYGGASFPNKRAALDRINEGLKRYADGETSAEDLLDNDGINLMGSSTKEGKRNSSPDGDRLQQIHDLAVLNGASCPMVMKEADGKLRWVLLSSNAFQDSDKEIISQKALEADVARTDKAAPPLWAAALVAHGRTRSDCAIGGQRRRYWRLRLPRYVWARVD